MGYAFKGNCYATAQEAKDVHFESVPPSFSGNTQTIFIRDSNGDWFVQQGTFASNGAYTQNFIASAYMPVFASCSEPSSPSEFFADGQSIGWDIAAAMLLAWGIWVLRRGT